MFGGSIWKGGMRGEAVILPDSTVVIGSVLLDRGLRGKGVGNRFLEDLRSSYSTVIAVGITNRQMHRVLPRKGFKHLKYKGRFDTYYWTRDPSISKGDIVDSLELLESTPPSSGRFTRDVYLTQQDYES